NCPLTILLSSSTNTNMPTSNCKARLSFILAAPDDGDTTYRDPWPETEHDDDASPYDDNAQPTRASSRRLVLPPLSKKLRFILNDVVASPIDETINPMAMCCCSPDKQTTTVQQGLCKHKTSSAPPDDTCAKEDIHEPETSKTLASSIKRRYNRERQQLLRRHELHQRRSLRAHVDELEATKLQLQQQLKSVVQPSRTPSSQLKGRVMDSMLHQQALTNRSAQYAAFIHDVAQWASRLQHEAQIDMQWLQTHTPQAHDDSASCRHVQRPTNMPVLKSPKSLSHSPSAKPAIPAIYFEDLRQLPPESRKRMYNRLRQRLYRQRELEEVDALHAHARDLTDVLRRLKTNEHVGSLHRLRGGNVSTTSRTLQAALEQNEALKAKLRRHCHLSAQLDQWVHNVSSHVQKDVQLYL
ncbi:hypothetical protein H257_19518, partial [Aphanomyces astaci]